MPRISPMTFSPLPCPVPCPRGRPLSNSRGGRPPAGSAARRPSFPAVAIRGGQPDLEVAPAGPLALPVLDGLLEQRPRRLEIGLHGTQRGLRLLCLQAPFGCARRLGGPGPCVGAIDLLDQ